MKKQIHKKTIIRDGKEETVVTEDTHVEQDSDGPPELRDSMQTIIDQFIANTDTMGSDTQWTQNYQCHRAVELSRFSSRNLNEEKMFVFN